MAYLSADEIRTSAPALADAAKYGTDTLETLVAEFEQIAEEYTGTAYELRYTVDRFLQAAAGVLLLSHPNVRSITSLTIVAADGTSSTVDSSLYALDTVADSLAFYGATPWRSTLHVAYSHGLGARTVTDGVTNTDTSLTSATASFTVADIGAAISGTGIPTGTTIASVTSATVVVLSAATIATGTGVTITIGSVPATVLRACREYVRSCALADRSGVPRDVIGQSFGDGGYTRFSTPDWNQRRPTGWLEVDRLLNSLPNYRTQVA